MNDDLKKFNNDAIKLGLDGHFEESIVAFLEALKIEPGNAVVMSNLGGTLERAKRLDEALDVLEIALQLDPTSIMANLNRGLVLAGLQRFEEAIESFDVVVRLCPGHPYAIYNRGLSKMTLGDCHGGFIDFHAGLALPFVRKPLFQDIDVPHWDGRHSRGETLIIIGEQGYGDSIMFMRYLPYAMDRVGKVVLGIHDKLAALYKIPDVTILTHGETIPPIDLQCSLLSLPYLLGENPDERRN